MEALHDPQYFLPVIKKLLGTLLGYTLLRAWGAQGWSGPTHTQRLGDSCPLQVQKQEADTRTCLLHTPVYTSTISEGHCYIQSVPISQPNATAPFSPSIYPNSLLPKGHSEKHWSRQCSAPEKRTHGQVSWGNVACPMLLLEILNAHCHI